MPCVCEVELEPSLTMHTVSLGLCSILASSDIGRCKEWCSIIFCFQDSAALMLCFQSVAAVGVCGILIVRSDQLRCWVVPCRCISTGSKSSVLGAYVAVLLPDL